ncbi:hypothetical protein PINS_up001852 [Pythium insidiosum]|nr:hypothetical protein PINS_up001852 [Pythium insidiosum]
MASLVFGAVTTVLTTTATERDVASATIRERFTRVTVLQHLVFCLILTVVLLVAINESHYSFPRVSRQRIACVSRALHSERPSRRRANAFAVLAGISAACATLSEKCVAKLVLSPGERHAAESVAVVWTTVLPLAWGFMAALHVYWWQHAVVADPSTTVAAPWMLWRLYLITRLVMSSIKGALFFDDSLGNADHTWTSVICLTLVATSLSLFSLTSIGRPKREDDVDVSLSIATDASLPVLLDASQQLLDGRETDVDMSSDTSIAIANSSTYHPPVYFKVI